MQLMTLHASGTGVSLCLPWWAWRRGYPHLPDQHRRDNVEERRLAYVGITRAQTELTFTLCKERRQFWRVGAPEPSRFLLELPQDDTGGKTRRR